MADYLNIAARMVECEIGELDPRLVETFNRVNVLAEHDGGALKSRQLIAMAITLHVLSGKSARIK